MKKSITMSMFLALFCLGLNVYGLGVSLEAAEVVDSRIDTPTPDITADKTVTVYEGEYLNFTGTPIIQQSLNFNGTVIRHAPQLKFDWKFGDTNIPNSQIEDPGRQQFKTPGTFEVSFKVMDTTAGVSDPTPDTRVIIVEKVPTPPKNTKGVSCGLVADVDGLILDWGTSTASLDENNPDFFDYLYNGFNVNGNKIKEAMLFLRYNEANSTLYALVYAVQPRFTVLAGTWASESFIKDVAKSPPKLVDGTSGDDGIAPDFQWVGSPIAVTGTTTPTFIGWEASAKLDNDNDYVIIVHAEVWDSVGVGSAQTAGLDGKEYGLEIACGDVTAISLISFTAAKNDNK